MKQEMLIELKEMVYEANMELPRRGLVTYTWGNVSGIDRERGLFVIKPSGVPYEELDPEMMVVMDLDGNQVGGRLRPSSDTPTHLELTAPSRRSEASYIHIPRTQRPGHSPAGPFPVTVQPMQIISMARSPVPEI